MGEPKRYEPSQGGWMEPVVATRADTEYYIAEADYLALRAECEALRANAERYRWLRDAKPNALHLSRNGDHACNYMTASAWIDESEEWFAETPPEEIQRMRDTDTIWELQIYPDTPIGSYTYYASTLDAAIDAGRGGGDGCR